MLAVPPKVATGHSSAERQTCTGAVGQKEAGPSSAMIIIREAEVGKRPGTKWPYRQQSMCKYVRHRISKSCNVFKSRKEL